MPTVAELERLGALTERLIPLADMQRGELIRADSWNLLTGAVLELARALLAESKAGQVADHEHVEEVDVGWLTPRLRALISQGGLTDPAAEKRLGTLERDGKKIRERLDETLNEFGRVRTALNDVKIGDIGRTAEMTVLRRKFEAQSDARDEVLALRETLATIQDNIGRALELGENISIDGEIPDFPNWLERITALETLRERLTNPDGTLLDAADLAIRLAEFQNEFVTQEQLDEALEDVRTRPPQDLVDALREELQGVVDERLAAELAAALAPLDERFVNQDDFQSRLDLLAAELLEQTAGDLRQALADLEQRFVNQDAFQAALNQLAEELRGSLGEMIPGEVAAQLDAALAELNRRFVTPAQLNSQLATFYDETRSKLLEELQVEIGRAVDAAFEQRSGAYVPRDVYEKDISALWAAIEELQGRSGSGEFEGALAEIDRNFVSEEEYKRRTAVLEERLMARVEELVKALIEEITGRSFDDVRSRLDTLGGLETRLNTAVSNQLGGLRQEVGALARQAAQNELQGVRTGLTTLEGEVGALRNRLTSTVREEVKNATNEATADLRTDLNVVRQRVTRLDTRLSGLNLSGGGTAIDFSELGLGPPPVDNLIEIDGLGEAYTERLLDRGIRTFAQLAALSDEQLADLLETTPRAIARWQIQAQAAKLAES